MSDTGPRSTPEEAGKDPQPDTSTTTPKQPQRRSFIEVPPNWASMSAEEKRQFGLQVADQLQADLTSS